MAAWGVDEPYRLRRGRFELRRTYERTMGISFRHSFDAVLRRLDVTYIEEAWSNLAETLPTFGISPDTCQWGECHSGLLTPVDGSTREDSPVAGVGWLLTESDVGLLASSEDFLAPWPDLDAALARQDPPLCLVYDDHRAQRVTFPGDRRIDPSDATTGLELLLALMVDDISDWRGQTKPGTGAWLRMANAIAADDESMFADAVIEAHQHYTTAGLRLCLEGFSAFLLRWTHRHWTPHY